MVKYNSTEPLKLETGAEGVVGHAGLWQIGQFVDFFPSCTIRSIKHNRL